MLNLFLLHPSAPLTHKYALRTLPHLNSLPLEWQKNRSAAVPANIRMQKSSTGLAAMPHLKAPQYFDKFADQKEVIRSNPLSF